MVDASRPHSRRTVLKLTATAACSAGTLAGCLERGPSPAEQLESHRSDLDPLQAVEAAHEAGYRSVAGYHRVNGEPVGLTVINEGVSGLEPAKPHAVLFDLTDDGEYEPLGLKWFVPASAVDEPPELFGTEFSGPFDGPGWQIPRHYALHAWRFRENSDGLFATTNPDVEPPSFLGDIGPAWETLRELALGRDAQKAGYENTEKCVATGDGGYGVPFVDADAESTEPSHPPVLLYRITSNWNYRLLGAEWFVATTDAEGPPSLFGQPFHRSLEGHSPKTDQPRHYGLHGWLSELNPRGLFAPFNPGVTC